MRYFKRPLIVTAVALPVALVVGLAIITWIHNSELSNRKKMERAQMAGSAVAVSLCLVIAPFWLIGAAQMGKERREQRK